MKINYTLKENNPVQLFLTDLLGKKLELVNCDSNKGDHSFTLDLKNYSPGIYFISLRSGEEIITRKIVVE